MSEKKMVFFFGGGVAEGDVKMKDLLGGKGANLAEMTRIGVPVPAGFTICTEVCTDYFAHERRFPANLDWRVKAALGQVEAAMDRRFGDPENPLLVSVRSGARVSMPGMMDTVLNLGLNDQTVQGLILQSGKPRFAYDCYRRFVQMYGNVVMGVEHHNFEHLIDKAKERLGKVNDVDLSAEDWMELVAEFKARIRQKTGREFPEDPWEQLWGAVAAVFNSWYKPSAVTYRRLNKIPEQWGTAVNVQAMVFGNMGEDCATGVAFTRDPSTGENGLFGEYLINAQGEDVVAGIRTPCQITTAGRHKNQSDQPAMEETMPRLYRELVGMGQLLEKHYREMQDLEFTIQNGKLWLLQTRTGKRSAQAALTIAVAMVKEGLINREEALLRVDPQTLDQLLHPTLDPEDRLKSQVIATGLPASPGAAAGQVAFSADEAELLAGQGLAVILFREETSPEDIHGMHAAKGIVTVRGGMTSHAAVVARGMGRPCVSGCGSIKPHMEEGRFTVQLAGGPLEVKRGDWITIDGSKGEVLLGQVKTRQAEMTGDFARFMSWADETRRMKVRTNADTPADARVARTFGAEGIGLCRTEHMFFDAERIVAVREMILSRDEAGRRKALAKLLPMQRFDFEGIFREMKNLPVTIRLLDPPLHEFIPHDQKGQAEVAVALEVSEEDVRRRVSELEEANPMLGHRGCRLAITYPEIYEMQVRAIMEAACRLVKQENFTIVPEIMIPLVGFRSELAILKKRCMAVCEAVMAETGVLIEYLLGTMIELPRAALRAEQIALEADFFSFGTNDLTQTTLGLSRDDAGSFLGAYVEQGVLTQDPFVSLDQTGVGQLVALAAKHGREIKPKLKLGICGEHGGDPASIGFFEGVGLDYVSCSPFRVPIARLAAAQAVLRSTAEKAKKKEKSIKIKKKKLKGD
ncbi:MAG: pyruvate, phosphate dikinase [Magnetococcales bacterium]|nr:pyruvate, phosphate dikinase [Magnetococcales bacterium]MBF0115995.1 pyruvate, phosphate dikinase [Magnetococcales bacterium]